MICIIFIVSAISRVRTLIGGDVFSEIDLLDECDRESKWCLSQSRVKDYMEELRTNSRSAGVTVVLNHWQRPAENLRLQLRAAIAGVATAVWVCIFGSPLRHEYDDVIVKIRQEHPDLSAKVSVIHSDVDFGVYGRFLLASSAKTRFVFVVDDDVAFPVSIVDQYLQRMEAQTGIWGHAGHVRSIASDGAKWIVRPRKPMLVDYANAAWFLETSWLSAAFLRERPATRLTGEDIHLSYTVKRTLGLDTRVVGWRRDAHVFSKYTLGMTDVTTLTPSMFSLRSFIVRRLAARGSIMRQAPGLDALAFVEMPEEAEAFARALGNCVSGCSSDLCRVRSEHLSNGDSFQVALVFSGLQLPEDRSRIERAAADVCLRLSEPACRYTPHELCGAVCEEMEFAKVMFFNLRVGSRLIGSGSGAAALGAASAVAAVAADALEAASGLFGSLKLTTLFVPHEDSLMRRMVLEAGRLQALRPQRALRVVEWRNDECHNTAVVEEEL